MKTLNRIVPVAFGLRGRLISGDYSEEDPPVPISNTVVKLLSADDTWRAAAWESRTSPVLSESSSEKDCFLLFRTWLELMQLQSSCKPI